jgi:hypothetical protein
LVDVDWANPDVCYEFVHVLLDSVAHGFTGVRLDAFAYVWKAAETYASAKWHDCSKSRFTHRAVGKD